MPTLLVSVALTSCLGQNNSTTQIRGINLIEDSPTLEFVVDTTDVSNAIYGSMTQLTGAHPGTHAIQVAAVTPSNLVTQPQITYENFGNPVTVNMLENVDYTVIAYNTVADPKYLVTTQSDLTTTPTTDTVVFQIIHAAPKGPQVDVYFTAPEAGITVPKSLGSLSFGQSSDEGLLTIAMPTGLINTSTTLTVNFTIELRDTATGAVVVPPSTITISEQNRALFVIADNIGPGTTPVVIDALVSATGAAAAGNQLANINDVAELAFANVSSDSPPFNVIGGLTLQGTLATNIGFGQKSAYGNINADVAGTIAAPTSDPTKFTFIVSFTSSPDQSYTEYAIGPYTPYADAGFTTVQGLVLQDDRRTVPIQGEFRFVMAAWSLQFGPDVDIYLTPHDAGLNILASNGNRPAPNFQAQTYKTSTSYTQVAGGTYDVYFAYTGTSNVFLMKSLPISLGTNTTFALTNTRLGAWELIPFNDGR